MIDIEKVKKQAKAELEVEAFAAAVEKYKEKLRNKKSLWDRIFPWKIVILRKGDINAHYGHK